MIAPVEGSGSWPAWMQRVSKRAVELSFTRGAILISFRSTNARRSSRVRVAAWCAAGTRQWMATLVVPDVSRSCAPARSRSQECRRDCRHDCAELPPSARRRGRARQSRAHLRRVVRRHAWDDVGEAPLVVARSAQADSLLYL